MGRGRYGSMVPAGRRKGHRHKWADPLPFSLVDRRLFLRCTVKSCPAVKAVREPSGKIARG